LIEDVRFLSYISVIERAKWRLKRKEIKMAKGKQREVLVVVSKVKDYIKSKKCMTSGDLPAALSEEVYALLDKAIARAKSNKRSTVRPDDL
jgi:ribosomal protein L22